MSFSRPSAFAQSKTRFIFGPSSSSSTAKISSNFVKRGEQRGNVIFLDSAGVERGVGLADHFENRGLRLGGVEVVFECGASCVRRFRVARDCISGVGAVGENCLTLKRRRKFRRRSTETAACLSPSKVKLS